MMRFLLPLLLAVPLAAQNPPAISDKAATQLVADWKARNTEHEFACLYAHREDSLTILIDSVGPTGKAAEMFCDKAGGIARFVDERGVPQQTFAAIVAAMDQHPGWLVATEIYATEKGVFGNLTEVPLGDTVIRKEKAPAT